MSDEEKPKALHLQALTPRQSERVIGGAANIIADMVVAYVEAAGPHCAERLFQLRRDLIDNVRNRAPLGLALEEEPGVVETLVTVIEVGFSCIVVEPPENDAPPGDAGDDLA